MFRTRRGGNGIKQSVASVKYRCWHDLCDGTPEYFSGIEKPESRAERGTLCLAQRLLNTR